MDACGNSKWIHFKYEKNKFLCGLLWTESYYKPAANRDMAYPAHLGQQEKTTTLDFPNLRLVSGCDYHRIKQGRYGRKYTSTTGGIASSSRIVSNCSSLDILWLNAMSSLLIRHLAETTLEQVVGSRQYLGQRQYMLQYSVVSLQVANSGFR